MPKYYALADSQNGGGLMHTGRNDTTKDELAKSLLSYYEGDHPISPNQEDVDFWEHMKTMSADALAEYGDFEILEQSTPFPDGE